MGAAAAVGAASARQLAALLEQMGRSGQLDAAALTFGELRRVIDDLDGALGRAGLMSQRRRARRARPPRSAPRRAPRRQA
jgi:HPt (histidine-containing phosphotransfer) domain-containing protein